MAGSGSRRGRRVAAAVVLGAALCAAAPAGGGTLAAGTGGAAAPQRPHRIVSLNLCADQLLMALADRDQIAGLTWLSANPMLSADAAAGLTYPRHHGSAEAVLALRPDLVIASRFTAPDEVAAVRRAGVPLLMLPVPATIAQVEAQIAEVAAAIGQPQRGAAINRDIAASLAAAPPAGKPPLRAIVVSPNGFTVGAGSLADDVMQKAGLVNLAAEQGLAGYDRVPLERIARAGADLLIFDADPDGAPALAGELRHHPALIRLAAQASLVDMPSKYWTCGGPGVATAVRLLSAAAREVAAEKATQ